MVIGHDFKNFPELTNKQMQMYYFDSPHKQITEDFDGQVTRVIDGDTVMLKWQERDFEFPVRFVETAAPELKEKGGKESKEWLRKTIEGHQVTVKINRNNRVGKFGRLLGRLLSGGVDINEESIRSGHAVPFSQRKELQFPDFSKDLDRYILK